MNNLPVNWQQRTIEIAIEAGAKIVQVYNQAFDVENKQDGSPLTQADKDAHHHIENSLNSLTPQIPVVSEESYTADTGQCVSSVYWLVDPLDGTKEFVKRNGEFTVNIALMKNNNPVWGVVYAPVMGLTYYGGPDDGAIKRTTDGESVLNVNKQHVAKFTLAVSRSHISARTRDLFAVLENAATSVEIVASGSSLKFCMIAQGQADCYPRLGLTSEWDTAAAQAVLEGAGGEVIRLIDGKRLDYNKPNILNPEFMACGKLAPATKKRIFDWYHS